MLVRYGTLAELELLDAATGETVVIPGQGEAINLDEAGRLVIRDLAFLRGTVCRRFNHEPIGHVASLTYQSDRYVPRRADESTRKNQLKRRYRHQSGDEGGQTPIAVCFENRPLSGDRINVILDGGTYKVDRNRFGELGMIRN